MGNVQNRKTHTHQWTEGSRAMVRQKPVLSNGKKGIARDKRVSVCSDCRYGIFEGHEYLWTKRGLVHNWCEDKRQDEAKAIT